MIISTFIGLALDPGPKCTELGVEWHRDGRHGGDLGRGDADPGARLRSGGKPAPAPGT